MYKAIFFDIDGTLILKNDIYQFLAYLDETRKSILIDNVKEIVPN